MISDFDLILHTVAATFDEDGFGVMKKADRGWIVFYLYMIIDIYSRKVIGREVYPQELSEYASIILCRAVLAENCIFQPLVPHADSSSPRKGSDLKATMEASGVRPSYSRPRVSDDNPYSEAIFRS